jgi:hypothetical protein
MNIDNHALILLSSYVQVCENHAQKLQNAILKVSSLVPFTPELIANLNETDSAFLEVVTSRFAKLQDTCGQKIFPLVLKCSGENVDNLTFIDILNLFEKFEFIESADFWLSLRKVRNAVAHEYPDNLKKLSEDVNEVFEKSQQFLKYWQFLRNRISHFVP